MPNSWNVLVQQFSIIVVALVVALLGAIHAERPTSAIEGIKWIRVAQVEMDGIGSVKSPGQSREKS